MIEITDLSFAYGRSKKKQISHVDLSIKKGEFILLCGKSACGKTTMAKSINGLIPHFLEGNYEGSVVLEDQEINDFKMYQIAEKVGSVFQNPKTQFFNLDSDSELIFGLENIGMSPEKIESRIEEVVADLEIEELLHRNVFELSGGEKQALAIASVYAVNPDVYVLDEPSANIDKDEIMLLRRVLEKLKREGKTIVIAEHRLYFLMDLIDRAVFIENGEIKKIFFQQEFASISDRDRKKMGLRAFQKDRQTSEDLLMKAQERQLEIKNLSIIRKRKSILKNINLTAQKGDVIAVTGKNGVGKSTLMRCLCGLIRETEGEVKYFNKNYRYKKRRSLCYMVMQDVVHQLFSDSVEEECKQSGESVSNKEIDQVLRYLDLYEYREKHPMSLSGGQKQRLAIATATLSKKDIIVLDEPTSGLDYDNMCKVGKIIHDLSQDHIVFVITHDEELVTLACNRRIELQDGKLIENIYIVSELGA